MLCDVVRRRRRWAHAPVIHAASHFDPKKRVAWVPISMHTCGSFFYNYGAPLGGGPSGRRSSAMKIRPIPAASLVVVHTFMNMSSNLKCLGFLVSFWLPK